MIDLSKDEVVGEIINKPGVYGLVTASELGRGLVTCGRDNKAATGDQKTLKIIFKVDTDTNPDEMLYEPSRQDFTHSRGAASRLQ